jgi:hypothetical protein
MLATLADTPFDDHAVKVAIDVAREHGVRLIVVDVVDLPPVGRAAPSDPGAPPAAAMALGRVTDGALAAGVDVMVIRGRSPRPLATLVELVSEHRPCLLVFAPDPEALSALRGLSRRRYRRAVRLLDRRIPCLLWTPELKPLTVRDAPRRATSGLGAIARQWPSSRRPY